MGSGIGALSIGPDHSRLQSIRISQSCSTVEVGNRSQLGQCRQSPACTKFRTIVSCINLWRLRSTDRESKLIGMPWIDGIFIIDIDRCPTQSRHNISNTLKSFRCIVFSNCNINICRCMLLLDRVTIHTDHFTLCIRFFIGTLPNDIICKICDKFTGGP
ncbi:hypothetical protein D1872_271260 [compost metagenome]